MKSKILGKQVKDKLTGFKGVAIARTEFLDDTPSVKVVAPTLESGAPLECWFTESRLELQPEQEKAPLGFVAETKG